VRQFVYNSNIRKGDKTMRVIYIVVNKATGKEILRTYSRVLAYKMSLKNVNAYVMYMRKERI